MQRIASPFSQIVNQSIHRSSTFVRSINQSSVRTFVSTANVLKSVTQSNKIDVLTTKSGSLQLSNRFLAWARGRPEASMLRELRKGNFHTDPIMIRLVERFGDNFGLENAASTEDLVVARYEYDPRLPREIVEKELNETGTFDRDAVMIKLAKDDRFKSVEQMSTLYELLASVQRVEQA